MAIPSYQFTLQNHPLKSPDSVMTGVVWFRIYMRKGDISMANPQKSHTTANYRIRLKGHLDDKWSDWFEGMEICSAGGETVLSGQVADQAALHGLFTRIRDMNLTLLSVEQLDLDPKDQN
jgi:hypothetical protein